MARPVATDLDFGGKSRVKNLPAPAEPGDAVTLSHLNQALSGVVARQVISEDLAITGTAVMFGTVSIAAGKSVVVPADSKWVVYK